MKDHNVILPNSGNNPEPEKQAPAELPEKALKIKELLINNSDSNYDELAVKILEEINPEKTPEISEDLKDPYKRYLMGYDIWLDDLNIKEIKE